MALANYDPYLVKVTNNVPDSYDWRIYNHASPIKDQGVCSSFYFFRLLEI